MKTSLRILRPIAFWMCLVLAGPVQADSSEVSFFRFDGDSSGFSSTIASIGYTYLGRESFDSIGLGQSGLTPDYFLAPGVASGAFFPAGTSALLGIMFQTNSNGGDATAPSPGGRLYATGPFQAGDPGWLGPDLSSDSLDVFIDPPGHQGDIRSIAFDVNVSAGATFSVKVFDNSNSLVSEQIFPDPGLNRVAIVAAPDLPLFRINLHAETGFFDVGEVELYAVPEPAAVGVLVSLVVLGTAALRRRPPT